MARDTGFPDADAENDFTRMRRHAEMSRLMAWFTRQPADVNTVLPFDEVVAALGRVGGHKRRVAPFARLVLNPAARRVHAPRVRIRLRTPFRPGSDPMVLRVG